MKRKVIAIGLDSAPRELYRDWMAAGELPTLSQLRRQGAWADLKGVPFGVAEASWTVLWTGCHARKHGYWSQLDYLPERYTADWHYTYDYEEFPPFYALGEKHRVCAFDIPQVRLSDTVNGYQVLAYGAHSPQTPRVSSPGDLLARIIRKYGDHPAILNDYARIWRADSLRRLHRRLVTGAQRRGQICRDLLAEEDWDLFLTVFGEVHSGGHHFWHLSQSDHPWYRHPPSIKENLMLDTARAVDRAMGHMLAAVPEDTAIVAFSQEGLAPNNLDIPSMAFLPELLYRMNFPGETCLHGGSGPTNAPVPPEIRFPISLGWTRDIWARRSDDSALRRFLRHALPMEMVQKVLRVIGDDPKGLDYPKNHDCYIQVPLWYSKFWPQMKAFALPSFGDGYVRLNLKGREPNGIVDPDDYDAVCDEIAEAILALRNPRTGRPLAADVIRPRRGPFENDAKAHPADLGVLWRTEPADIAEHPRLGRIGPFPHRRSGGHNDEAFMVVRAAGVPAGGTLPEGNTVDVSATILDLLGLPFGGNRDGRSLLPRRVTSSVVAGGTV
ncbi:alkaline phosphatase family protein [Novispirillum sp. DQ9]|uniref:alkaline phosphatase family protein n=1 Tax=Novispirillum sp. DQ9 TaxID=3398612 RepID=UPI003C7CA945